MMMRFVHRDVQKFAETRRKRIVMRLMTSQFVKDLFMFQWELNSYFNAGSDQVRRREIKGWFDPITDAVVDALRDWESKGYVTFVADPRNCKDKDVCLKILKHIDAVCEPRDLNEDAS